MTTAAQTTLIHAAEFIEVYACVIKNKRGINRNHPSWGNYPEVRGEYDDALTTALELRLLAKRIIPITAVSPVPTFEGK
jgi:hypothetical protein